MNRLKYRSHSTQPPHPAAAPADNEADERMQHNGVTFEEAVRCRAYQNWESAGRPDGDGVSFWLQAEAELSDK